jgi:ABC-type Co2+ transport system permease subunit
MAHIHLPDVTFAIQWVILWWTLTIALLAIAIVVSRRQTITVERLSVARLLTAASFAIFQVNTRFASGDLADYNTHTERVRQ